MLPPHFTSSNRTGYTDKTITSPFIFSKKKENKKQNPERKVNFCSLR
jgi:hypothetical protein